MIAQCTLATTKIKKNKRAQLAPTVCHLRAVDCKHNAAKGNEKDSNGHQCRKGKLTETPILHYTNVTIHKEYANNNLSIDVAL